MSAQRFGRFWLHHKIGTGGSSEIFRATIGPDPETYAFELALKRLYPKMLADPLKMKQFYSEAELGKLLHHPNVVQVYESGIQEQSPYLVMEYIWGMDLAHLIEILRRRRLLLPYDLAIYIAMQVLRALDYVHSASDANKLPLEITHADVTPSNIFITYDGLVKIGDFGVAQYIHGRNFNSSFFEGKIKYMPPEIWRGKPVEQTTDLWSLTACLFEMLTAKSIFETTSDQQLLQIKKMPDIPYPHTINETIPLSISKLMIHLLHPRKNKRPQDAATLYRLLKQILTDNHLQPDAQKLSQFVRSGTQFQGHSPSQINHDVFQPSSYTAPIEISPTQRYEIKRKTIEQRNKNHKRIFTLTTATLFIFALISLWYSLKNTQIHSTTTLETEPYEQLMKSGWDTLQHKNFKESRSKFEQALSLSPKNQDALLGLAKIDYHQQQWLNSQQKLLSILKQTPHHQEALCLLGHIYQKTNKIEQAQKMLKQCSPAKGTSIPQQQELGEESSKQ